ncbi:unnamed protein product [Lupinus luteus]|uniref:UDP-3-O-acyl-N-acetylglucosamine deacetylase n=1 Tax=Lupinus luteus TaxID=3873 RepID=A0AAV1X193_LUPLU
MSAFNALRSSKFISWKPTGGLQKTLAGCVERRGKGLHSGEVSTVRLCPAFAGEGRSFYFRSNSIPALVDFAQASPLCTTLSKSGFRIRTVEHLLSALEASGVDNCRIEVENLDDEGYDVEIPIFDGSAREWVASVEEVGLKEATDRDGKTCEKIAPHVNEPVHVWRNDSFVAAFPSEVVQITYGISFPQAPAIGSQWFSTNPLDNLVYSMQIALSRTFCIYEEEFIKDRDVVTGSCIQCSLVARLVVHYVFGQARQVAIALVRTEVEQMRNAGLIKGGSLENAIVCSTSKGWLNPPLHFSDEPCRHKVLDLIGDLSLSAQFGNQGLPVAHIVAYKAWSSSLLLFPTLCSHYQFYYNCFTSSGGHALHADLARRLMGMI